jgi:hypothetical protein
LVAGCRCTLVAGPACTRDRRRPLRPHWTGGTFWRALPTRRVRDPNRHGHLVHRDAVRSLPRTRRLLGAGPPSRPRGSLRSNVVSWEAVRAFAQWCPTMNSCGTKLALAWSSTRRGGARWPFGEIADNRCSRATIFLGLSAGAKAPPARPSLQARSAEVSSELRQRDVHAAGARGRSEVARKQVRHEALAARDLDGLDER